ncbi:MAG: delta-class carbonic anhydrase [Cognaticolwellia sp.]
MKRKSTIALIVLASLGLSACNSDKEKEEPVIEAPVIDDHHTPVADEVIVAQRAALEANTDGKGFGPQSPRDIDDLPGTNPIVFTAELPAEDMNLCNIHFHENAEHKGGEFTEYAGNGDGHGYKSGYKYSGTLDDSELVALDEDVCPSDHGSLQPGATIEVHYVHSTSQVDPGATLGACLSDSISNTQLRVDAQVYVLVNDDEALDFADLTAHDKSSGKNQALNIPSDTGIPVVYTGSTTGPGYNEAGSPFQVNWNVRPQVAKVNIKSVGKWCQGNAFNEDHAHGVRNLVQNPKLLSTIN